MSQASEDTKHMILVLVSWAIGIAIYFVFLQIIVQLLFGVKLSFWGTLVLAVLIKIIFPSK